jgi:hypothetical protein
MDHVFPTEVLRLSGAVALRRLNMEIRKSGSSRGMGFGKNGAELVRGNSLLGYCPLCGFGAFARRLEIPSS